MKLAAGRTKISINEKNGCIACIEDTASGLTHVSSNPDRFLFRLTVPDGKWTSRYADNSFSAPRILKKTVDKLHLQWDNLATRNGPSGVDVETRFWADSNNSEIRFSCAIKNRGSGRITEVYSPIIAGWTGIGGKGKDWLVLGAHSKRDPHRFPVNVGTTYIQLNQKSRADYPVDLYAPWADISGPGGGLSLINYMEKPKNGTFFEYNAAGYEPGLRLAFGWRTPCVIEPGEEWISDTFGISVHNGDWHGTADRYARWMEKWFIPPPGKRSLREMIGFQNVWIRGFDGAPFFNPEDIPTIAADGRRFGVNHLCIWDEPSMGIYERHDNRDLLTYSEEEKKVLRHSLRQAYAEGSNVNALVNFRLFPSAPAFADKYLQDAAKLLDGSLRMEDYSLSQYSLCGWTPDRGPANYVASPFSKAYQERVLRWTEEYIDLGYISMFYDQPFETTPDYGRIADGCRPEDTYAAVGSLVAAVRRRLHENNPNAYIIGEFCDVFMSQYIDLWMSWYREEAPALRAAYSIPQTMHSWVVDRDCAQATQAFAMGMYLCLCTRGNEATLVSAPDFGAHLLKLAQLRKRCAERTVHARFRDNRGIEVKTGGDVKAYAFDSKQGPAVIVAALNENASATVAVNRTNFSNFGNPEAGKIVHLNGQEEKTSGEEHHFELGKNEVAVWML